jgi:hypothetical protein
VEEEGERHVYGMPTCLVTSATRVWRGARASSRRRIECCRAVV